MTADEAGRRISASTHRWGRPGLRMPPQSGLVNRFGTGRGVMAGFAAFPAAYLLFLRVDGEPCHLGVILPTMLPVGTNPAVTRAT